MYLNKELLKNFLDRKEITWLGVDFSQATFTQNGFDLPTDAFHFYFNEWNKMFITDQKKYNLRITFQKPIVNYDLRMVTKKNIITKEKLHIKKHIQIENTYNDEFIIDYISQLKIPQNTEFAVLFIVESLDQNVKAAAVWVCIIHTTTKQTVLCERFTERPKGFNVKSYWARVFYNITFRINDLHFEQWINFIKDNPN